MSNNISKWAGQACIVSFSTFFADIDKTNKTLSYCSSCASLSTNDNTALLDNPIGLIQKLLLKLTAESVLSQHVIVANIKSEWLLAPKKKNWHELLCETETSEMKLS